MNVLSAKVKCTSKSVSRGEKGASGNVRVGREMPE